MGEGCGVRGDAGLAVVARFDDPIKMLPMFGRTFHIVTGRYFDFLLMDANQAAR